MNFLLEVKLINLIKMEPFLLNLGFISRTNRGRVATKLAYQHLGIDIKDEPSQGTLLN